MAKKKSASAAPAERKPLAVISSDNHLAPKIWADRPQITGDAYFGMFQVSYYAMRYGVPLILAGDTLDSRKNDPDPIRRLRTLLSPQEALQLAIYFIRGQHDGLDLTTWIGAVSDWPVHLGNGEHIYELGSLSLQGFDWMPADKVPEALTRIEADIVVMHQVCLDLMHDEHAAPTPGLQQYRRPEGLSELYCNDVPRARLLIIGNQHRPYLGQVTREDGSQFLVLSPGSTCLQSIDEFPEKCAWLLFDDLTLERLPLVTRTKLEYGPIETEAELVDRIARLPAEIDQARYLKLPKSLQSVEFPEDLTPSTLSRPLVHITYQSDIPDAYKRLRKAIAGQAEFFPKELRAEPVTEARDLDEETVRVLRDGVLGRISHYAPDPDSWLSKLLHRCLAEGVNQPEALDRLKDEFFSA